MGDESEEAFAPTLDSGGARASRHADEPQAGSTLAKGRYVLQRMLGRGGMGTAWLARDTLLMRPCVIKLLHETAYHESERVERFLREARLTARLRHEHVVATYDMGVAEDGVPYLVLERLEGRPLDDVLRADGAMSVPRCVAIGVQILRGLVAAHAEGVVHHDLKPANVFLTRTGVVKLLDFGIAAFVGAQRELNDPAMGTAGTPFYMAPEQWRGTRADARSDVWAVGAVLFELLTGRQAFAAPTPSAVALRVMSEEPNYPVALHVPGHAELVAQIQHALQKDITSRPPDARTMLASLEALWSSVGANSSVPDASRKTPSIQLDANVGFAVHAPPSLPPNEWTRLLAFAHRALDADEAATVGYDDPIAEVARQAREVLGNDHEAYGETSPMLVPRNHELTFALRADGVRFDPPSRTFAWSEPVHRELFLARPDPDAPAVSAARMEVYVGALLLAEVRFELRVGAATTSTTIASARPFEEVFVAYADEDEAVAKQLAAVSAALTPTQFVEPDAEERAAGVIGAHSQVAIDRANAMQVLWSTRAMASELVDSALRYALQRRGIDAIRPVCWEAPVPVDEARDRPPAAIRAMGLSSITGPMTALLAMVAGSAPMAAPPAMAAPAPPAGAAPRASSMATPDAVSGAPTIQAPLEPLEMGAAPRSSGGNGAAFVVALLLIALAIALFFWLR